jgi:uncharacterized protein YndB with AHSA1/START domain
MADPGLLVEQEIHIAAPPERVFALLTDPDQIARWMPVTLDPRVGGAFRMGTGEWEVLGEVTALEPPRRISFTWDFPNRPIGARTEVTFELEPEGGGTRVRVRHTGFVTQEEADAHARGWTHYTGRLAAVAEGRDPGPDELARA